MKEKQALDAFSALSQETRLRIVRLLVVAGPAGMAAGAIGEKMDGASSSRMSFHLSHLEQAGLVASRREGRSIVYSVRYPALSSLVEFLMRDCCGGHPEICQPAVAALSSCCPPTRAVKLPAKDRARARPADKAARAALTRRAARGRRSALSSNRQSRD